jgi:putative ubiquitin-RnfH superfamily antitoxin RatB of RatAB toxin-antitoxin module
MAEEREAGFVDVIYALPDTQVIVRVEHRPGLTALDAVERSGLAERYPAIEPRRAVLGVFGVQVAPDYVLEPEDRVEICRPLEADPRQMRRTLAERGHVMGETGAEDESNPP